MKALFSRLWRSQGCKSIVNQNTAGRQESFFVFVRLIVGFTEASFQLKSSSILISTVFLVQLSFLFSAGTNARCIFSWCSLKYLKTDVLHSSTITSHRGAKFKSTPFLWYKFKVTMPVNIRCYFWYKIEKIIVPHVCRALYISVKKGMLETSKKSVNPDFSVLQYILISIFALNFSRQPYFFLAYVVKIDQHDRKSATH